MRIEIKSKLFRKLSVAIFSIDSKTFSFWWREEKKFIEDFLGAEYRSTVYAATGEFTKWGRNMSSQLFVCRGIDIDSVKNSWDDISWNLFVNSPAVELEFVSIRIHISKDKFIISTKAFLFVDCTDLTFWNDNYQPLL